MRQLPLRQARSGARLRSHAVACLPVQPRSPTTLVSSRDYSLGRKARMTDAGTKYLAISFSFCPAEAGMTNFRLIIPSRHLRAASNTPDPELPVVATSLIAVGKRCRNFGGIARGE